MEAEAIQKIVDLAETRHRVIDGYTYSDKPLHRLYEDNIGMIPLKTLTGVVDFLEANIDGHDKTELFINIQAPGELVIFKKHDSKKKERDIIAGADCFTPAIYDDHGFLDNYQDIESALVGLRTRFENTPDREKIIKLLGNIVDKNEVETGDDGMTQSTVTRKGIAMREKEEVPLMLELIPYRTFPEIDQPSSWYIIRLRSGEQGVSVAIYEVKDNQWKVKAMQRIKDYLADKIKEVKIIM